MSANNLTHFMEYWGELEIHHHILAISYYSTH